MAVNNFYEVDEAQYIRKELNLLSNVGKLFGSFSFLSTQQLFIEAAFKIWTFV